MRIYLLISLLVVCFSPMAQSDTVSTLMDRGNIFLEEKNYEQASYYFNLALSFAPIDTSAGSDESIIKQMIISTDSICAYGCENSNFLHYLKLGDSLRNCCEIASIRAYDQALKVNHSYKYPENRISDIIESSPEVQKRLLVIDARRKRKLYSSEIELALFYYNKGDFFKAMRLFERTNNLFKEDTLAKGHLQRLRVQLQDEIETFDNLIFEADSLYLLEEFKAAKTKFELAQTIDKECSKCDIKIRTLDYLIARKKGKKDWELLKKEADANYKIGNYEMAHYQFMWLYKHDVNDLYASKMIREIEKILEDELDERMIVTNAKLLLEKADHEFILGHYYKAKEAYLKIANRYKKATEHLIYVQERIKDCQHYLDEGKSY